MRDTPSHSPARWYVRVDDSVYGPFDDATLRDYMREGRVTAQSFISQDVRGEFRQVATYPAMMLAIGESPAAASQALAPRLIMAEIRSGRSLQFLQLLQTLGPSQRVGDSVWVLSSALDAAALCDVLSRPLGQQDRMMVLDAKDAPRASFNLGQSVDERLAEMFR